jgi:hypothetical protein
MPCPPGFRGVLLSRPWISALRLKTMALLVDHRFFDYIGSDRGVENIGEFDLFHFLV